MFPRQGTPLKMSQGSLACVQLAVPSSSASPRCRGLSWSAGLVPWLQFSAGRQPALGQAHSPALFAALLRAGPPTKALTHTGLQVLPGLCSHSCCPPGPPCPLLSRETPVCPARLRRRVCPHSALHAGPVAFVIQLGTCLLTCLSPL